MDDDDDDGVDESTVTDGEGGEEMVIGEVRDDEDEVG